MTVTRSIAAAAVFAALAAPVRAEAPPPPAGPLSLDDVVARTVARHPAIAAQHMAVKAARARADQTRTGWYPRVSLEGWYRYAGPTPTLNLDTGLTIPGTTGPVVINRELGTPHNAGAKLTVGWRAWDFGARDARTNAANAMARAAEADGSAREAELAYAARAAYAATLLFDEVAATTDRALNTARQSLADANAKKNAGLGADVAIAAAGSRVAELEARLVEARSNAKRSRQTLRLLLGLPPEAAVVLGDSLADTAKDAGVPEGAELAHPAVRQLEATSLSLGHQRKSLLQEDWPTFDLFAQVGYQFPQTFVEDDTAGVVYAVGITMTWSLFDGDLRRRQRRELDARRSQIAALRRSVLEQVAREQADADAQRDAALGALVASQRRLKSAQVYLKVARGALAAGAGTALDVRNAEVATDQAQLALIQARFQATMAQAARLRALGLVHASTNGSIERPHKGAAP